ncbi:MAG: CPBP family intramembrane metalloprotease [Coriobacteriia bacterium]|nr:CPBP family intramembrane metalloprotease [Coriobacteriia bacterium]
MARRSAKATAARARRKPAPRKRIANVRPWRWLDVAWVAVALFVATVLTVLVLGNRMTALMPEEGIVAVRAIMLIVFYLMLLAILAYRAHCRNLNFSQSYRLRSVKDKQLAAELAKSGAQQDRISEEDQLSSGKIALVVIGLFCALRLFVIVYTYAIGQLGWELPPPERLTDLFGTTLFGLVAVIASIVILAPIIEELVFRVIMLETFAQKMPFVAAAVLQALVFSLYHFSLWAALPNILLALSCAYLVRYSKTTIPAIVLHMAYNAAPVAAAFYLTIT